MRASTWSRCSAGPLNPTKEPTAARNLSVTPDRSPANAMQVPPAMTAKSVK